MIAQYYTVIATLTTVVLHVDLSYAVTPPPGLPQWTVKDDNGKICLLMAMNATIQGDPNIPFPATATASPQTGSCDSKIALFTLEWLYEGTSLYKVNTAFKKNGNSYKMVEVNGTVSTGFSFSSWSDKDSSFPSASVGHSMTCKEFDSGTVYFYEFQFQPFAQQSGEEYGEAEACSFGLALWVFAVFVAVVITIVILVAVVVVVKMVKPRRNYSRMQ